MKRKCIAIMLVMVLFVMGSCGNKGGNASTTSKASKEDTEKPSVTSTPTTPATVKPTPAPTQSVTPEKNAEDYIVTETIESAAIAKNIVEEPSKRNFFVCLPPSYYDSDKKYPVVYYLHGQAEANSVFPKTYFSGLFSSFEKGSKEFILVCVDGYSNMGGAFYANSTVSGNWEDYVVDEVVSYIDSKYRTIAERDSRGICGFSMGGFGAYNLALRHPDVYCCTLAFSPGALADGDLAIAMETWKNDSFFLTGYGRAFSPNEKDADKKYANIPKMDNSKEDQKIVEDWYNGFGNLNKKLDDYLALKTPLKAIKIVYGKIDPYTWIPRGCEFFGECMKARDIDFVMEVHTLGHMVPVGVADKQIIPFFEQNLTY